jgi:phage baseplate assembly protein W
MADEPTFNSFLGTGWAFPPGFNKGARNAEMVSELEDIRHSLHILLSTRPGERIMQPTFGCNLEKLMFEPLDASLKTYVEDIVKTAILYHEPRIEPEKVSIEESQEEPGTLYVVVDYKIRGANSRYNYVYPFYKEESTSKEA